MTDGDKLIDDFSGIVAKTIRKYVKNAKALQEIANVLDDMGDDAYNDGFDEGTDIAHENLVDAYREGYLDAQKDMVTTFKEFAQEFTQRIEAEFDDGN